MMSPRALRILLCLFYVGSEPAARAAEIRLDMPVSQGAPVARLALPKPAAIPALPAPVARLALPAPAVAAATPSRRPSVVASARLAVRFAKSIFDGALRRDHDHGAFFVGHEEGPLHAHGLELGGQEPRRPRRLWERPPPGYAAALRRVVIFSGALSAAEFAGGVITRSVSVQSDAIHVGMDVLINAGIPLLSLWLANHPVVTRRGAQAKLQPAFGLLSVAAITAMAGFTAAEAAGRLQHPQEALGLAQIGLALLSLAANGASAFSLWPYRGHNASVKGAFLHAATDALGSLGIIAAGLIGMLTGWKLGDPIVSLAIVALIVGSTWPLAASSWKAFWSRVPPKP